MSDPAVILSLKSAAQNALDRGFSILICQEHKKDPWFQYSEHAVVSAKRELTTAWDDGHEANYGIAGGKSNLAIIDCDHGLQDETALDAWMAKNELPKTFVVRSGRKGEAGFHLYYSGAVPTCGFQVDGVTGEIKSEGGYVVGPGSIHPSGDRYTIIHDIDTAPLPDSWRVYAQHKNKTKADFQTTGELIPEGSRWIHLQKQAGTFKNLGLSEDTIYHALKDFAATHCEGGDSYPDEKMRNLASWAASDACDVISPASIVTVGSPDPEIDTVLPEVPVETIDGDYVGDLALALTNGTFIPPSFARADLKTILGAMLDGNIVFPGEETIHMRHWTAIVSTRPETGKSICWERCIASLHNVLTKHDVKFPPAGFFSSGEHAIKVLAEHDNKSHLLYFDEMKSLFEKGNGAGSTLFPKLLELYEQKASAVGSLTHSAASFGNVSLSMAGNFTRAGYDRAVAGKGAGGDGFLSRMVLDFSNGINYQGDWDEMDTTKIQEYVNKISEALITIINWKGDHEGKPFSPPEDEDAKKHRSTFQKWLVDEKKRIQIDQPDSSYASRLEAHFKRDLLIRVAFTPSHRITKTLVEKSWRWAKHQLALREELWPVDTGGAVEKFEKKIVKSITAQGPLTKAGVQKFCNIQNGEGGFEAWNRAWTNLLKAEKMEVLRVKDHKGREKFGFKDGVWHKTKFRWIFG